MVAAVLGDAWRVYRALWRRSVVVAGAVFLVIALADALASQRTTAGTSLVSIVLALVGGLLVQGALVAVVRDLLEHRPLETTRAYYDRTRGRLGTLLGASILYGIGVLIGFVLLLIPGLIAIARWALIVPLVVIEERGVGEAFARSSQLVRGRTGRVLLLVVVANVITGAVGFAIRAAFGFLPEFAAIWIGGTIASALAVPYEAHVLTVLYYRLTAPDRSILPA
ncbi:MAG TPA: glycerophosphoryl diester phosphodiesterase membrane domain-containing protein [Gaiellaceae bacterium]|nr:glycerophosphoryl diester phosphodiesterase membrane domain-containing protein [Gaiellaceae bacterium]